MRIMNRQYKSANTVDFLISALHDGCCVSTLDCLEWVKNQNEIISSQIRQVPLSHLNKWAKGTGVDSGRFCHESGKFFSIDGINVKTNYGIVKSWDQPIINQPEIGILGIIAKKINGILHFLLQAKIEPGNINLVQLSPTLQATKSNYLRTHNGKAPLYLDYFIDEKKVHVLVDQLQSEQGSRFLQKRNRNIIIEIDEEEIFSKYDNFIWLSLKQIKELLQYQNIINMDTRTVISCIQYGSLDDENIELILAVAQMDNKNINKEAEALLCSLLSRQNHFHTFGEIIRWITSLKCKFELQISRISIEEMKDWIYDGNTIEHIDSKYFSVIGVNVQIGNREVVVWDQPMVKSAQEGIMGFLVKKINGIYHFLVQAKLEPGNFDIIELAPTVQCLTGSYQTGKNEYNVPYLKDFFNVEKDKIWYSAFQSEEGGRFFQEQNLNIIVEVGDDFPLEVKSNYCWMTLNQLLSFVIYNNYVNISARSLISAIRFC